MKIKTNLSYSIKIDQFDGPFHVLVELLESQKLNITEVSLSKVTEQYLEALNLQPNINPYTLADFLVISARLLYLKSKMLLPMLDWQEDEEVDLESQLKIYKEYYDASKVLEKIIRKRNFAYARDRLAVDIDVVFNPPHNLTIEKLKKAFLKVIKDIEPIVRVPKRIINKTISIREKINYIKELIMQRITANFSELLKGAKDKTETIVTFLAMLELVKQKIVHAEQDELHGEITIEKISNS